MKFVNISGTAKKVWMGVRLLRNPVKEERMSVETVDVYKVTEPSRPLTGDDFAPIPDA